MLSEMECRKRLSGLPSPFPRRCRIAHTGLETQDVATLHPSIRDQTCTEDTQRHTLTGAVSRSGTASNVLYLLRPDRIEQLRESGACLG